MVLRFSPRKWLSLNLSEPKRRLRQTPTAKASNFNQLRQNLQHFRLGHLALYFLNLILRTLKLVILYMHRLAFVFLSVNKGSFTSLQAFFTFKRRVSYFITATFMPAVVLVILSWCCFWIDRSAVPARVALSITTILTTILLYGSVNSNMPKVILLKQQTRTLRQILQ